MLRVDSSFKKARASTRGAAGQAEVGQALSRMRDALEQLESTLGTKG